MAGLSPTGYGPNAGRSSTGDPRGRTQNQSQYQQQRFEQQQGPVANQAGYNYGRASEQNFNDYGDIMGGYANAAAGGNNVSGGRVSYDEQFTDPYAKYKSFSDTGGYSGNDIANLRSRGAAPVRAAYANAEKEVGRQRALQGGYSPNATATLAKMAREQGQAGADAMQNVEAGIVNQRNANMLSGAAGMKGIGDSRLGAQLDAGKFNASMQFDESNANQRNRLDALQGMTSLYGATPGMAGTFGNQAIDAINAGGNFGNNLYQNDIESGRLPGQFDQTMGRVKDIYNTGATMAYPWIDAWNKGKQGGVGTTAGKPVNNEPAWVPGAYQGVGGATQSAEPQRRQPRMM